MTKRTKLALPSESVVPVSALRSVLDENARLRAGLIEVAKVARQIATDCEWAPWAQQVLKIVLSTFTGGQA